MSQAKRFYGVYDKPPLKESLPLSIQHLFAMFSASILVPNIFGINPAVVLLFNGIGTLLFILCLYCPDLTFNQHTWARL